MLQVCELVSYADRWCMLPILCEHTFSKICRRLLSFIIFSQKGNVLSTVGRTSPIVDRHCSLRCKWQNRNTRENTPSYKDLRRKTRSQIKLRYEEILNIQISNLSSGYKSVIIVNNLHKTMYRYRRKKATTLL